MRYDLSRMIPDMQRVRNGGMFLRAALCGVVLVVLVRCNPHDSEREKEAALHTFRQSRLALSRETAAQLKQLREVLAGRIQTSRPERERMARNLRSSAIHED